MKLQFALIFALTVAVPCVIAKDKPPNKGKTVLNAIQKVSTPEECARPCRKGAAHKICYFKFTLELYATVGGACNQCTNNASNVAYARCQCVLADGVERTFLSANRMLPGPGIQVCEGDKVVIDVDNHMEGLAVTLHWHGILQHGTQYYDGVPFVTQCPIQDGNTFRYQWIANAGTHFWHAHTGTQKLDGLYGSVIVRQAQEEDVNGNLYDFDLRKHVILISDWLHENADERFPGRRSSRVGQEPDNLLINGKGQFTNATSQVTTNVSLETFTVTYGKRYRFRLINSFATVCPAELTIQGHNFTLIAADGDSIKPVKASTLVSFSGERYDFVVEASKRAGGAYWIQLRALGACAADRTQQFALLRYTGSGSDSGSDDQLPAASKPTYTQPLAHTVVINPIETDCNVAHRDSYCINQLRNAQTRIDSGILGGKPDVQFYLPFRFYTYNETLYKPNTYNKFLVTPIGTDTVSLVDEISYRAPPSPLLSQYRDNPPSIFCNDRRRPASCDPVCACTHKLDVPLHALVEMVIVDEVQIPTLSHPFHLHGYSFHVVGAGRASDANVTKISMQRVMELDRKGLIPRSKRMEDLPPAKDTIAVPNNGYVVIRFRADNPGFWLFHCHFLYHILVGMDLVVQVGKLSDLPPVPPGFPGCGDFRPPIEPIS